MTPTPLPPLDLVPTHTPDRPAEHFTQLWPGTPGQNSEAPFFLALMSPFRALALGVLWSTSAPGRLLLGLGVVTALVTVLLIAL